MTQLNPQQVAEFLLQNPNFLQQNPDIMANQILHITPDGVDSLLLHQQQLLRKKNQATQDELTQLKLQAKANQHILELVTKAHQLLLSHIEWPVLEGKLDTLFSQRAGIIATRLIAAKDLNPNLLQQRLTKDHYLGRLSSEEQQLIFNQPCCSAALFKVSSNNNKLLAVLAFASDNPEHFVPDQDILILDILVKALQVKLAQHDCT